MTLAHNQPLALEMAYIGVEECLRLGASYADARFELRDHEELRARNGHTTQARMTSSRGLGLRVLVRGSWAFVALSEPTRHDVSVAARRAVEMAKAAAILSDVRDEVPPVATQRGVFRAPVDIDPFEVSMADKLDVLRRFEDRALRSPQVVTTRVHYFAHRARKVLVTSEGSEVEQDLTTCHLGFETGASDGAQLQVASCPAGRHGARGGGWERLASIDPEAEADRLTQLAVQQLEAPCCPVDAAPVIFAPDVLGTVLMAAMEQFDGRRPNRAGLGEVWTPGDLDVWSQPELSGGAGSIGFDDEGIPAQAIPLVMEGKVISHLLDRAAAHAAGLETSSGCMRAASWATEPQLRPTNLVVAGGTTGSVEDLQAETEQGFFMEGLRSLSVRADGTEFFGVAERAWRIEDGKRTRMLRNPAFRGGVRALWQRLVGIGTETQPMGLMHQAKGRSEQLLASGVLAPHGLFREVEVGSSELPPGDSVDLPVVNPRSGPAMAKAAGHRQGDA
ncbi:MAG: TldD/PmbA family protein [Myxococcota bacterium]